MARIYTLTIIIAGFLFSPMAWGKTNNYFRQQKDSLLKVINTQKGEEKLAAYHLLVTLNCPIEETDNMLKLIDDYIDECSLQQNVDAEMKARQAAVSIMFNYNKEEHLQNSIDGHLAFFREQNFLTKYYRAKRFLLERAFMNGAHEQSLKDAQEMYKQAKADNFSFGIASANYFIGLYYINLAETESGEKYMREALLMAENCTDQDCRILLIETYFRLCEFYINDFNYKDGTDRTKITEIESLFGKWRKEIARLQVENRQSSYVTLFADYFVTQIQFNIAINNLTVAENYCDSIESTMHDPLSVINILHNRSIIAKMKKDYPLALEYNNRAYEAVMTYGNLHFSLHLLQEKIDIISQMKNAPEIMDIWNTFRVRLDSLHHEETNQQLHELRIQYEVDKHIAEKEQNRNYFLFALGGVALLLIFVVIILINRQKIHKKNVALVRQILEQRANTVKALPATPLPAETDAKPKPDRIFLTLENYMQTETPFTDSSFNRETISQKLSTNVEYLRQIIKKNADCTIGNYILHYRLRFSRDLLLRPAKEYTIEAVALDSGFGSRNTFHELFRKTYGLTPSEFRKIAAEEAAQ